jgi:hypothetical protein
MAAVEAAASAVGVRPATSSDASRAADAGESSVGGGADTEPGAAGEATDEKADEDEEAIGGTRAREASWEGAAGP